MLSKELKELEINGIVKHSVYVIYTTCAIFFLSIEITFYHFVHLWIKFSHFCIDLILKENIEVAGDYSIADIFYYQINGLYGIMNGQRDVGTYRLAGLRRAILQQRYSIEGMGYRNGL